MVKCYEEGDVIYAKESNFGSFLNFLKGRGILGASGIQKERSNIIKGG